mgnify:CR=1 FL=1
MNRVKLAHLPFQNMLKEEINRINGGIYSRGRLVAARYVLEKAVDIFCTEALGRRSAIVAKEILYPVAVGLLSPFAVSQPVNGKGNAVNQILT